MKLTTTNTIDWVLEISEQICSHRVSVGGH